MKSLLPEFRRLILSCRRKGKKVKERCNIFGVSAYTVWKFEDMPRTPKTIRRKIDATVENGYPCIENCFQLVN